MRVYSTINL